MIKMIREFTNSELAPGVIDRDRNSKFQKEKRQNIMFRH